MQQLLYRLERLDPARLAGDPAALELELATPEMPFVNVLVPRSPAGTASVQAARGRPGSSAAAEPGGRYQPVLLIAFGPRFPETVAHVIATWTDRGTVQLQVLDERERGTVPATPAAGSAPLPPGPGPAGPGAAGTAGPGGPVPGGAGSAPGFALGSQLPATGTPGSALGSQVPATGTPGSAPGLHAPAAKAPGSRAPSGGGPGSPAPPGNVPGQQAQAPAAGALGSPAPFAGLGGLSQPSAPGGVQPNTGNGTGRPAAGTPASPELGRPWNLGLAALFKDAWLLPGRDGQQRLLVVTEHHPAGGPPVLRVTLLERAGDMWQPSWSLGRPDPVVQPAAAPATGPAGIALFPPVAGAPGALAAAGQGTAGGGAAVIRQVSVAPDGSWIDLTISTGSGPVLVTPEGPASGLWEQRWIWTGSTYMLAWNRPVDRALSVLEAFITLVSRGRWADAAALVRGRDPAVVKAGRELLTQQPLGQGWRVEAAGGSYERGPLVVTRGDGVRITVTFAEEPASGGRTAMRIAAVMARGAEQAGR